MMGPFLVSGGVAILGLTVISLILAVGVFLSLDDLFPLVESRNHGEEAMEVQPQVL